MGEGPGAAEALSEFGAGIKRKQSGGDLLDSERKSSSMTTSSSNFSGRSGGRSRGGSVGRDTRLYGDVEEQEPEEWGTEVEGLRMGEVSALTGEGESTLA